MKVDYTLFERAVGQLKKSYNYLNSELARQDAELREQFRAATIKAFEYTYELSIAMIRRQLAQIVANPRVLHQLDFADLMREAADAGVICNYQAFLAYRELRSKTPCTYESAQAEATVEAMGEFLPDMHMLLAELRDRNRLMV